MTSPYSEPVLWSAPGGPHLPPTPLPLPRCGRGRGGIMPHTFPWPPAAPPREAEEGGGSRRSGDSALASVNDTESTNQITPLPQRGRGGRG